MKRLVRAATAWLWAETALKLAGLAALAAVLALAWTMLKAAALVMGVA